MPHSWISLRSATNDDRAFVEGVYFETQRWLIEALFGWRGDEVEQAKFSESYDAEHTSIVVLAGEDIGWLTVRQGEYVEVEAIYLKADQQRKGIGTELLERLIQEAEAGHVSLNLSTAKINPARRLYERLGFAVVREDEFKVYLEREPRGPI